jgi:nitrile hydratase beta subunit-like protein
MASGLSKVECDEPVFHHDWERRAFAIAHAALSREDGSESSGRHIEPRHQTVMRRLTADVHGCQPFCSGVY